MKKYKVTIARDTAIKCLGFHGLHIGCLGIPNVEVVGLFDSKADDLDEIMAATQAKTYYTDYLQMLDTEKPDIVILCSRHPNDHFEQIKAAAERGIHIYCEKPMTVSLKEADAIIELVKKHNIKLCVAHPARYNSAFLQMKKMIEDGEIGKPLTVHGRGKSDHRGGGEDLMTLGTHILDLETFFFGNPESVRAEVRFEGKPIGAGDTRDTVEPIGPTAGDDIFATFRFKNEVRGIFESRKGLSQWGKGRFPMGIAVIGTEGTITMRFDDYKDAQLKISRTSMPPEAGTCFELVDIVDERIIPGVAPLDQLLKGRQTPNVSLFLESNRFGVWDLIQSIENDREPISNMYNARTALEMIYAIYDSQISDKTITIPLTNRNHPL